MAAGFNTTADGRRWYIHMASAFPLPHHHRAVMAWILKLHRMKHLVSERQVFKILGKFSLSS